MYWKIVRVNGDGSLRLIYNGTSTTPDNSDLVHSYAVGYLLYNLSYDEPKYTGYTYDNGTDSYIKKEVDTWYSKALGNTEYDSKVIGGRFCSDSSGYKPASDYGFSDSWVSDGWIFLTYDRLGQTETGYTKENSPTLKCPATTESYGGSYRLKAGLIIADELVLAGESLYVDTDNYLSSINRYNYYSMTPAAFIDNTPTVWNIYGDYLDSGGYVVDYQYIRPVINVSVSENFSSGDGTVSNPYVIS